MHDYESLGEVSAGREAEDRGHRTMAGVFRVPDAMWERVRPLIPAPQKVHPFGGGRSRVPDRQVLDAIFFVLRTGCQWNALSATGICSGSTAHRRFQQWQQAGFFDALWQQALEDYDSEVGITRHFANPELTNGRPYQFVIHHPDPTAGHRPRSCR